MRKWFFRLVFVFVVASLALAACGGGQSGEAGPGNVENGKKLYESKTLGQNSAEGCVSCHNYDEAQGLDDKAPYTKGTGTRAATRVAGLSDEEYIRESIIKPDAYVVEGYNAGDMYQKWEQDLSKQEMNDLVAYLMSEK